MHACSVGREERVALARRFGRSVSSALQPGHFAAKILRRAPQLAIVDVDGGAGDSACRSSRGRADEETAAVNFWLRHGQSRRMNPLWGKRRARRKGPGGSLQTEGIAPCTGSVLPRT